MAFLPFCYYCYCSHKLLFLFCWKQGIMTIGIIPAPLSVSEANNFRRKACASPGGAIAACSYGIMAIDIILVPLSVSEA